MQQRHTHVLSLSILISLLAVVPRAGAQAPSPPSAAAPREEAAAMGQYWVLLAQGRHDEAAASVAEVLRRYPKNISALAIVVEATIARGGAGKALDVYEGWLGRRTLEEPGVLRRIARAYLYELAGDAAVRAEALQALARDGEQVAAPVPEAATTGSRAGGSRPPAKADAATVDRLVADMNAATGVKMREIRKLADTGSPRAAHALLTLLRDQWPENRALAADALGRLGTAEHIAALRPLLKDPHGVVRVSAAGALYRLGDSGGVQILLTLAASEQPMDRLTAARLLAPQPDENWINLVRGLTSDSDPSIRLQAARLIAPHDPPLARNVLSALAGDANATIRTEAAATLAEAPDDDLATLRRVMRSGTGLAKIRAADRVLALTRQPG